MPSYGSNAVAGIDTALQLLRNSGFERGRILLISDEIAAADVDKIATLIDGRQWQLSMIGVGTEQGAPIVLPGDARHGGFVRQATAARSQLRNCIATHFLSARAKSNRALRATSALDDSDIARVLPPVATTDEPHARSQREFDQWRERGPQLVMLLLPLAALAFRRGWLLLCC